MTSVKICGLTTKADAIAAADFGADLLGFVLWPGSPRVATLDVVTRVRLNVARRASVVGVFVNPTADEVRRAVDESGIRMAQIHGVLPDWGADGAPCTIIRAVHLAPSGEGIEPDVPDHETIVVLDAHDPVKHGGTGRTIDWSRAAAVARHRHLILAGGLTAENVREAIAIVNPMGVDVASGVESAPGIKDHDKMRAFIAAAKEQV